MDMATASVQDLENCEQLEEVDRTFLFTDIVGSTQQLESAGIREWAALIDHHRRSVRAVASVDQGTITGFTGDGFVVVFETEAAGVHAALRLQYALWVQRELDVRIGVAAGRVLPFQSETYVGLCIHRAARLCAACKPGEAIVEDTTYQRASKDRALPALPTRTLRVRGFKDPAAVRVSDPVSALQLA